MNTLHARANLVDAAHCLQGLGLRPFLVDGTLLGAVREGNFIGHDTDLDLGLFAEDYRPAIVPGMEAVGFAVHKVYGEQNRGLQYSFRRRQIKLDIFFYYADPIHDQVFHAAWLRDEPIRYGYAPFDLAPLAFLGDKFLAPAEPEVFLVRKYGPDWRTPVTPWDWAWGPRNARPWGTI